MKKRIFLVLYFPMILVRHRAFLMKYGLRSFIRTVHLNFRFFNHQDAALFPIYVTKNYRLKSLNGNIAIDAPIKTGMIRFGTYQIGTYDSKSDFGIIDLQAESMITFKGSALFGVGCRISVNQKGALTFGDGFVVTASSTFICSNLMTFGTGCLLSWEIELMDTDLHSILPESAKKNEIHIGDRNWIGSRCTILKSTRTGSGCVIGTNSLLNRAYLEDAVLIAGSPAKIIKSGVSWV